LIRKKKASEAGLNRPPPAANRKGKRSRDRTWGKEKNTLQRREEATNFFEKNKGGEKKRVSRERPRRGPSVRRDPHHSELATMFNKSKRKKGGKTNNANKKRTPAAQTFLGPASEGQQTRKKKDRQERKKQPKTAGEKSMRWLHNRQHRFKQRGKTT